MPPKKTIISPVTKEASHCIKVIDTQTVLVNSNTELKEASAQYIKAKNRLEKAKEAHKIAVKEFRDAAIVVQNLASSIEVPVI